MFEMIERNFKSIEYGNEKYLKNWPLIYILENGKEAYIGESNSAATRMLQHRSKEDKQVFSNVHFIYSREFNRSVTFDYESRLIQLMSADETYILTNGNDGIANKEYYNKEYYDTNFQVLWEKLRKKKMAKHTIDEIVNSDLFKYSPYKELNDSQREAVEEIFSSIEMNIEQPIIVNGMPGSGKTIVAIFLFKYIKDYRDQNGNLKYANKRMALVIPQTSLRKTLKQLFKHIHGLKS
jgi:RecG-like helicase